MAGLPLRINAAHDACIRSASGCLLGESPVNLREISGSSVFQTKGSSTACAAPRTPPKAGDCQSKRYIQTGAPCRTCSSARRIAGMRKTISLIISIQASSGDVSARASVYMASAGYAASPKIRLSCSSSTFGSPLIRANRRHSSRLVPARMATLAAEPCAIMADGCCGSVSPSIIGLKAWMPRAPHRRQLLSATKVVGTDGRFHARLAYPKPRKRRATRACEDGHVGGSHQSCEWSVQDVYGERYTASILVLTGLTRGPQRKVATNVGTSA